MRIKLKQLWRAILIAIRLRRRASIELRWTQKHPKQENLEDGVLIVVGIEGRYQKWAYLKCPCECGNQLRLNLSPNTSPAWTVDVNDEGIVSVYPSVRQTKGCYSHFWLKNGEIDWCGDTGSANNWQFNK